MTDRHGGRRDAFLTGALAPLSDLLGQEATGEAAETTSSPSPAHGTGIPAAAL